MFVEKTMSAKTGKLLHDIVYTWQLERWNNVNPRNTPCPAPKRVIHMEYKIWHALTGRCCILDEAILDTMP